MGNTERVHVALDRGMLAEIREACKPYGMSVSLFLRMAARESLDRKRSEKEGAA